MPKKILITGADGFIGQHVFSLLQAAGFIVTGISFEGGKIDKAKILKLDLCQAAKVARFFKKNHFDIIVHLAARVPRTDDYVSQKLSLIKNTISTLNILEEFRKSKTEKFIYASGTTVIGTPKNTLPVNELHPANPESLYTAGKYFGEVLCEYYQKKYQKDVVILRISAPYGPGQSPNNVIPIFIRAALDSKEIHVFGTGKRSQDFIYIDDVARAFLAAIKCDKSGIYNIGSGRSTSTLSLAKIILKNVPKSQSKVVFTGKDHQENYRLKMDISKAKKDLKFVPKIMIEEGIKKYVKNCHNF